MEEKKIYWHLPGLCYHGMLNHVLIDTMKRFPQMFMDGYEIGSVYGTFPGAIWNGGRNIIDGFSSKPEVERVIKSYNNYGIPVRFTWTNCLIEEKHTYDTYCNMIMKAGNNGMNQALVNTPAMEEYLRREYPNYKLLSSTTKRILDVDKLLAELEKDYFLVVLDYDFNHNEEVIEKLKPYADRIEILVNESCRPNCPSRSKHYEEISKYTLDFDTSIKFICVDPNPDKRSFKGVRKCPSFMSNDDIERYAKMGFRNFKIVGRNEAQSFYLDALIYFMVKPENRDFINKYILATLNKLRSGQPLR